MALGTAEIRRSTAQSAPTHCPSAPPAIGPAHRIRRAGAHDCVGTTDSMAAAEAGGLPACEYDRTGVQQRAVRAMASRPRSLPHPYRVRCHHTCHIRVPSLCVCACAAERMRVSPPGCLADRYGVSGLRLEARARHVVLGSYALMRREAGWSRRRSRHAALSNRANFPMLCYPGVRVVVHVVDDR